MALGLLPRSRTRNISTNANPLSSKEAASYDSKHEKTLNKLIEEIRERVEFIGADWVDDDDEAGDDGEVQSENAQTKTGLAASEMHAYQGNLCVPDDPSPAAFATPEFSNFDVAAVGLGFHHFDDPSLAARRLAERLKTGVFLVILDFFSHDKMDASHPASSTVTHHGFSEEQIRGIFEQAGVGKDFALEKMAVVFNISKDSGEVRRNLFMARGTKA
ncbi:hypothetical protein NEMBOFW57_001545 [Staphylotrichum longicolle]|uniref:Uncharacterized protein n=1 Tax=Staphylotrichum longicolle TaxID=669026 RepID=A0AAD4I1S5_9PEZI|nr:hypothetical protein NEMBOFW57_001545 [Staphylotrichum longicolle]